MIIYVVAALILGAFFGYLNNPASFPAWENPDMLAKYYVSTKGTELSQK